MSDPAEPLFDTLLERIGEFAGPGLTMVAVDAIDADDAVAFADALAGRLEADEQVAVRTGIAGFSTPRAKRFARGRDSAEGLYRDSTDLDALREALLYPARIGLPFRTAVFDPARDRPIAVNPLVVPLPAVLVFDGVFLHRKELRDEWDLTIWLDVPFAVALARRAARHGGDPHPAAPANRRIAEAQALYEKEARPLKQADLVIDYADPERPVIVRG